MLRCLISENGQIVMADLPSEVVIEPKSNLLWRLSGCRGVWEIGVDVRTSGHPENRELVEGVIFVFDPSDQEQRERANQLLAEPFLAAS